jgi:NAD(P)-dependent dehydrogenase (short-subunit alcohol dehydrogenase family)
MEASTAIKSVLVTGATGNIGLAVARAFATDGARVFLNDLNPAAVARVVKKLSLEAKAQIIGLPGDIAVGADVAEMFRVMDARGGVDAVVNGAADLGIDGPALDLPIQRLLRTLEVNVVGTLQCCQFAAKAWRRRKRGGVIVNISSAVARRTIRGRAGYVASKGGLDALTRALAVEWAPLGIRVCGIAPAYVRTDRWRRISAAVRRRRRSNIPSGKESTPEEVAVAIQFLCSSSALGFCGETLLLDGAATAQFMPADVDV